MAAPTLHLMWKEYRTLRPLWLGVLLLVSAIMLIWIPLRPGNRFEVLIEAVYMPVAASFLFAVAAICIVFAVEAEERTFLLLQQLSPTWWQLMKGKLSIVLLGQLSMIPALMMISLGIELIVGIIVPGRALARSSGPSFVAPPAWNEGAVLFAGVYLFCRISAVVLPPFWWSMTRSRVVTAAMGSVISILVISSLIIPMEAAVRSESGILVGQLILLEVAVWLGAACLTVLLSIAWYRGKVPVGRSFTHRVWTRRQQLVLLLTLTALIGFLIAWRIQPSVSRNFSLTLPVALRLVSGIILMIAVLSVFRKRVNDVLRSVGQLGTSEQTSDRSASAAILNRMIERLSFGPRRISTWEESQIRVISMLIWKDVATAVRFLLLWVMIGGLLISLCSGGRSYFEIVPVIMFLAVCCQECGLRTFRMEQTGRMGSFLAYRGVAPGTVWWAKTVFWGGLMLLGAGIALKVDEAVLQNIQAAVGPELLKMYTERGIAPKSLMALIDTLDGTVSTSTGWIPFRSSLPFAFVSCCFTAGLLAASWIRTPAISFFAATVLTSALLASMWFLLTRSIPFDVTLWPVLLVWLLGSRLTIRQSLDRWMSWRLAAGRMLILVVPVLLATAMALG